MGYNGDAEFDLIYDEVGSSLFAGTTIGYFKHLCGEHDTASGFAMWLATRILQTGKIPGILIKEEWNARQPLRILVYNQFRNINHSVIIIEKA